MIKKLSLAVATLALCRSTTAFASGDGKKIEVPEYAPDRSGKDVYTQSCAVCHCKPFYT